MHAQRTQRNMFFGTLVLLSSRVTAASLSKIVFSRLAQLLPLWGWYSHLKNVLFRHGLLAFAYILCPLNNIPKTWFTMMLVLRVSWARSNFFTSQILFLTLNFSTIWLVVCWRCNTGIKTSLIQHHLNTRNATQAPASYWEPTLSISQPANLTSKINHKCKLYPKIMSVVMFYMVSHCNILLPVYIILYLQYCAILFSFTRSSRCQTLLVLWRLFSVVVINSKWSVTTAYQTIMTVRSFLLTWPGEWASWEKVSSK